MRYSRVNGGRARTEDGTRTKDPSTPKVVEDRGVGGGAAQDVFKLLEDVDRSSPVVSLHLYDHALQMPPRVV